MQEYEVHNLIYDYKEAENYDALYALTQAPIMASKMPQTRIKLLRYLHKHRYEAASNTLADYYHVEKMQEKCFKCLIYASRYGNMTAKYRLIRDCAFLMSKSSYFQLVKDVNSGNAWFCWVIYKSRYTRDNPPPVGSTHFILLQKAISMGCIQGYRLLGYSYCAAGQISLAVECWKTTNHIHEILPETIQRITLHLSGDIKRQLYYALADEGHDWFVKSVLISEFSVETIRRFIGYIRKSDSYALSTFVPDINAGVSIINRDPNMRRAILYWHVARNNVRAIHKYQVDYPNSWPLIVPWPMANCGIAEIPFKFYPTIVRHALLSFLCCAKYLGLPKDVSRYICMYILTENGWIRPRGLLSKLTSIWS